MKIKYVLIVLCSFFFHLLSSQVPQGINYQALAGDASGNPLRNTTLQVKMSILSDTLLPVTIWEELHSSVKTNEYGVFSLVVGLGVRQSSSMIEEYSDINWSSSPLFLRTQVYYQGSWKNMGSSKLWTVPFAMVANNLSGPFNKLSVSGETSNMEEALFEVKNVNGQTVFAVYNEGVRVYVDDGAKGAKGGFAIGGFGDAKAPSQNFMLVKPDTIRMYIDNTPGKTPKGGFAIGGFGADKAREEEYFRVTRDSTRIYVNDNPDKKAKGGFAIGGFSDAKTEVSNFLDLTKNNYFIGHRSGASNKTGLFNSFLGYEAGTSNITGDANILLGYRSGFSNTSGSYNIFIGDSAGVSNTRGEINTFIGFKAGAANTTGNYNILIGDSAGVSSTTGDANVFVGNWAGFQNTTGFQNIIVGVAGYENTTGSRNVFLGTFAGTKNHAGSSNVYLGDFAGTYTSGGVGNVFVGQSSGANTLRGNRNVFLGSYSGRNADSANFSIFIGTSAGWTSKGGWRNVFIGPFSGYNNTGNDNVFLGNEAGYYETASNKLYISNSATISPLIYGEFDNGMVVINGNAGDNYTSRNMFVNGTAGGSTAWFNDSDQKLKHNIVTISDALQKVMQLRGVNFLWNEPKEGLEGIQMGFIGQEAATVVPEVVSVSNDHYSMQYAPVTALLVEAIKDQQNQIESQQKEIDELKALVKSLISHENR